MKKDIKHDKAERKLKLDRLNQVEFDNELKEPHKVKPKIISRKKKIKKIKVVKPEYETMSFEEILKPC